MHLNNTSQYAIRILNYLANHDNVKLYSAKELSDILDIPYKFLTKIMTDLAKANFVVSIRGRDGGFKLARKSSEITIMQIVNTFNQFQTQDDCLLGIGKCDVNNKCSLHNQWRGSKEMVDEMFNNTTLQNLEGSGFKI